MRKTTQRKQIAMNEEGTPITEEKKNESKWKKRETKTEPPMNQNGAEYHIHGTGEYCKAKRQC